MSGRILTDLTKADVEHVFGSEKQYEAEKAKAVALIQQLVDVFDDDGLDRVQNSIASGLCFNAYNQHKWVNGRIGDVADEVKKAYEDGELDHPNDSAQFRIENKLKYIHQLERSAAAWRTMLDIARTAHKAVTGETWQVPAKNPQNGRTATKAEVEDLLKRYQPAGANQAA